MKTLLLFIVVCSIAGCFPTREIQVKMVNVELVRIDTIRYLHDEYLKQILTWKDERDNEYVSYEPIRYGFIVGTRMYMLKKR